MKFADIKKQQQHILKIFFHLLLQNYLTNSTIWTFSLQTGANVLLYTVQKGDDTNPDNYKGISLLKDKSKVWGDFWHDFC